MTILAVTGLQRERRLLAGADLELVVGGGDHVALEATLERCVARISGIVSIGIAGALAPDLRPGDWLVATGVRDGDALLPTDEGWRHRLLKRLPGARPGVLVGVDAIVVTAAGKASLHRTLGAAAVDMESHVAARVARRYRLPFAAARVISDAAHRTLPPAALVGMRADGRMDLPAVLRALLAAPWQLPALLRTGLEAERGFRALVRGRRLLGRGLGGPDAGERPLDMI